MVVVVVVVVETKRNDRGFKRKTLKEAAEEAAIKVVWKAVGTWEGGGVGVGRTARAARAAIKVFTAKTNFLRPRNLWFHVKTAATKRTNTTARSLTVRLTLCLTVCQLQIFLNKARLTKERR